ncbi:MAG: FxLYD domain-containing protein [Clostridia bacterium]|nr:FxLYD domain-containing protein [Clostridia bacterium]
MKKRFLRVLLLILAISAFIVMAVGSGSSDTPATENTNPPTNNTNQGQNSNDTPKEKVEYSVGESLVVVWTNSIGTKWIKVGVPVTNTGNVNLYLESSSIDVENADGSLAATISMVSVFPQVIKPGETAYYFEETTYDGTETEGLKLVPHVKAEKAKIDLVRFEVTDIQLKDDNIFGPKVMGRVKNTSDKEASLTYVVANFFDKDGKFIGQQFTILTDDLPAGEKVGFETSSLSSDLEASDIATYDVVAFPFKYQW